MITAVLETHFPDRNKLKAEKERNDAVTNHDDAVMKHDDAA
jgi:hypothetical protein